MMGLTPRQADCLKALTAHEARTGAMPSVEELRRGLGLKSKSGIVRILRGLEQRGAIKRMHGCARAISVKEPPVCPHCKKPLFARERNSPGGAPVGMQPAVGGSNSEPPSDTRATSPIPKAANP